MARLSYIALNVAVNVLILMYVLAEEERYSDQFDNIDYRAALNNDTVRESYYNCFMEIAPCQSPRHKALTGIFSEAYQTKCKKCTEKQKEMFAEVAEWYMKNYPEKWQLIVAKTLEDMKKKAIR
ncbi:PREDICTED: ejaculatory bulb-specific protein 3-like [Cyphomyrmex costatus]|uniref:Putative odorant-binding protein A10 n=1 Tax=Cyphomyrmex costatus TaxID=456900 RepID=A0A151ID87_9HYME|nr:PREDICTED: ejaculatory bulb-specific protein 3-like [Cyphomyrmex costatus]KYM98239.1 Putative odorant-binding protein A10 [Cyphomyrmex costatus]